MSDTAISRELEDQRLAHKTEQHPVSGGAHGVFGNVAAIDSGAAGMRVVAVLLDALVVGETLMRQFGVVDYSSQPGRLRHEPRFVMESLPVSAEGRCLFIGATQAPETDKGLRLRGIRQDNALALMG